MLSTILLKLHGTVARDRQNVRAKANEEFVNGCIKNVCTPNTHNLGLNDETTLKKCLKFSALKIMAPIFHINVKKVNMKFKKKKIELKQEVD